MNDTTEKRVTVIEARAKMRAAIESVFNTDPFFSTILAGLRVTETAELPTMATDGKRLYWNRNFVDSLSISEAAWVVLHEAGHCFLGHHLRLRGKDRQEANIAFDLALNHIIRNRLPSSKLSEMVLIPGRGRFSDLPGGKDAEWYFDAITKPQEHADPEPEKAQDEADEPEKGNEAGNESEPASDDSSEEDEGSGESGESESGEEESQAGKESGADGSESGESGEGEGDSGASEGATDGDPEEGNSGKADGEGEGSEGDGEGSEGQPTEGQPKPGKLEGPGSLGEVLEAPEGEDSDEAEAKWKDTVAQAINTARAAGTLPGWLREIAEGILGKPSKTDWRPILRRWLTSTTNNGFSYSRPSRRGGYRTDIVMASNRQKGATNGAVLVDTSGSMSGKQMNSALDQIAKIIGQFPGSSVTMFQADVRLCGEAKKFMAQDFPLRVPVAWQGRGGTEMSGPCREIARGRRFDWLVIISDMYWPTAQLPNVGLPTVLVSTNKKLPIGERPRHAAYIDAQD